ncbi:MAG: chorismate-binding protein [Croceimicrobium sp.]
MLEANIFLAYRGPNEILRYYEEDSSSNAIFHFVDFNSKQPLKVAMRETAKPDAFQFHQGVAQSPIAKEQQIKLLAQTIEALKKGFGEKVVISRFRVEQSSKSIWEILRDLDHQYPDACVYCFSHPKLGTWFGASPENLMRLSEGFLQIDSLAGTRTWEERGTFTEKEEHEQGLVTEEILGLLEEQEGVLSVRAQNRSIKKAGTLAHLYTLIEARLDDGFPLTELLYKLHPTPAVGGRPKIWAQQWISEKELYNRRYYSGYFGWSNDSEATAQFWVNLRCAELLAKSNFALYLGGGITSKSVAIDEWDETEAKAQTILKVLD